MTTRGMTHEEARDSLEALALDALDVEERAAVAAHVARCVSCQQELEALQATAAELAYAARPMPMSSAQRDRIRARLVGRAAADRPAAPELHVSQPRTILVPHGGYHEAPHLPQHWLTTKTSWYAMAATLVATVSLGALWQVTQERDSLRAATQMLSLRTAQVDSLRTTVADRDGMIANLTGPDVAVVTLASAGVRAPSARMFWDRAVNAWTFVAHNLPAPKTGRTYQLWLVTANAKINAGTFAPDSNGNAVVRATYPLKDALAAVAVTDEPSAGSPQPTTTPLILGLNSTR